MRIASITIDGRPRWGKVEGTQFIPVHQDTLPLDLLDRPESLRWDEPVVLSREQVFNPPLPATSIRDFITFEQHTAGALRAVTADTKVPAAWYDAPAFYFTNPHAAIGSGQEVPIPPGCEVFDCELEVGIVIGKDGYNLSVDEAWDHIAGMTIFNDWSARDLQQAEMRVGLGPAKGKDTATTLGPVLVTMDELAPYRRADRYDMQMQVFINDQLIGSDTLASMAWSFAELVAYASRGTWVRRGDVIGSGTCGGGCLAEWWGWRGQQWHPPLQEGDVVRMTVEGLGEISNRIGSRIPMHPVPAARSVEWSVPEDAQ